MPTRAESSNGGVQAAVQEVAEHARTLVRLETKLATQEVREKVGALGAGAALLATGGVLGLFGLGFLLATVAAALATFLPTWLALLLVGVGLVLIAIVIAAVGRSRVRRGTPPVPEQAVAEAKLTAATIAGRDDG